MNTKSYSGLWSCFVAAFSGAREKTPSLLWFVWMKARTSDFIDFSKRLFFISTRWLARQENRGPFRAQGARGLGVSGNLSYELCRTHGEASPSWDVWVWTWAFKKSFTAKSQRAGHVPSVRNGAWTPPWLELPCGRSRIRNNDALCGLVRILKTLNSA